MVSESARARSSSGQSTGLLCRSQPEARAAGESTGLIVLSPAQIARLAEVALDAAAHDRLHWLADEVLAGRMTLADAEKAAARL